MHAQESVDTIPVAVDYLIQMICPRCVATQGIDGKKDDKSHFRLFYTYFFSNLKAL